MDEGFFERPILKSPYAYPDRHWELDDDGQPTNQILPERRDSKLLTPVPKPQKCRRNANQPGFVFDSGHGLSTEEQEYNPTSIINDIRRYVEDWRDLPNLDQWQVTLEPPPAAPALAACFTTSDDFKRYVRTEILSIDIAA